MRQRYLSSVVADLRKEPDGYVASTDGVDVVKAKIIEMSHCQTECQVLESKYSNCDPYPQFLSDGMPDVYPPKSNQWIYQQPQFRIAMRAGGVKIVLRHSEVYPKIENLEVQSWWCNDCGLQVEAPDG